jgi:hypothetical protein
VKAGRDLCRFSGQEMAIIGQKAITGQSPLGRGNHHPHQGAPMIQFLRVVTIIKIVMLVLLISSAAGGFAH